MEQEQASAIEEEVTEDFKKNIARLDAAGIFDEIAEEIVKVVENDEGFKAFVAEEDKHCRQKEASETGTVVVAK